MPNLGKVLLHRKWVNLIQLNLALDFQVFYGNRLGTNLLELGIISERKLAQALGEALGLPWAAATELQNIPKHIIDEIPQSVAFRYKAIPFRISANQLCVAMQHPVDAKAVKELKRAVKMPLLIHVCPELIVQVFLEKYYHVHLEPRLEGIWNKLTGAEASAAASDAKLSPRKIEPPDRWVTDEEDRRISKEREGEEGTAKRVVLSVQKVSLMLDEAKTRDEIATLLLQFAEKYVKRAALFVVRKDFAFGWVGCGAGIGQQMIKSMVIPLAEPSIFKILVESQGHYLGAPSRNAINDQFFLALGAARPANVLLLPLTVGGITFGALYGDNMDGSVDSNTINELQVVVSQANIGFQRLILQERQKAIQQISPFASGRET